MLKKLFIIISVLSSQQSLAELKIGAIPPIVEITGDDGGKVNGTAWNSSSIKGKVITLFYVDPDEKDSNKALEERLKKEEFSRGKFASIAVVNLKATWLPNIAIESKLRSKQKKHPHTIYVRDRTSKLVKEWQLKDDAYNVLLFNKSGELIFNKAGALNDKEIENFIELVKKNI